MPIPTQDSVIKKLRAFSQHHNPVIAQQADVILTDFLELSYDEIKANELENKLNQLLIEQNSSFDLANIDGTSFNDAIYYTLLQVGYICPRNARDEFGNIEDIISHESIPENYLFISSDRRQWDIRQLYLYFSTLNNQNRNPETKALFSARDIQMLKLLAQEAGISTTNSQNSSNRNSEIADSIRAGYTDEDFEELLHQNPPLERYIYLRLDRFEMASDIRDSWRPQQINSVSFYYHLANYCYLSLATIVAQNAQAAAVFTSVYTSFTGAVLAYSTMQQMLLVRLERCIANLERNNTLTQSRSEERESISNLFIRNSLFIRPKDELTLWEQEKEIAKDDKQTSTLKRSQSCPKF